MSDKNDGVRIVGLDIQDFLGVKAVALELSGDAGLTIIGGENGAGKTSVLDAIMRALAGTRGMASMPIRKGAEAARIEVTLDGDTLAAGPWTVTRTFTKRGTRLTITNSDGASYPSQQALLDGFMADLTMDPLAFSRLDAKAQVDALLDVVDVGIDLDANAEARKLAYHNRTLVNRDGKAADSALAAMPVHGDDVPDEEIPGADIVAEMAQANEHNNANEAVRRDVQRKESVLALLDAGIDACQCAVDDALAALEAEKGKRAVAATEWQSAQAEAAKLVDIDTDDLADKAAEVEAVNVKVRENKAYTAQQATCSDLAAKSNALTAEITRLDAEKRDALAAAVFPVPGMGLDENGVTFDGIPLGQRSSAEQLRVSTALAMAQSPALRVLRIVDGSLCDQSSMDMLEYMAEEHGFQIWIERVGDGDSGAVVIEDGRIRGADAEATQ